MDVRLVCVSFFVLLGIELISFLGYLVPLFGSICFILLCLLTLVLAIRSLSSCLIVVFTELMLGSHGYIFFLPLGSGRLSLRMGIFLMVLLGYAWHLWKQKEERVFLIQFLKHPLVWCVVLVWGIAMIQGYMRGFEVENVYADGNAFLYLALVPIFFREMRTVLPKLFPWVCSALLVQSIFVLFSAMTFFYQWPFMGIWYKWIRDLRVGEITLFVDGWVRVFFQSQIFVLLGLFVCWMVWLFYAKQLKHRGLLACLTVMLGSSLILSFSRSFWIGLVVGVLVYTGLLWFEKKVWRFWGLVCGTFVSGLIVIFCVYHIPFLSQFGGNIWGDLFHRLQPDGSEAAAASRWSLLPVLWKEVSQHVVWGAGFGKEVTYVSSDPRIVSSETKGVITTFAFEWGFLDLWLKTGLVGVLLVLFLGGKLCVLLWKEKRPEFQVLVVTVVVLYVVHFFTPFVNHPLGLAYMAVLGSLVYKERSIG